MTREPEFDTIILGPRGYLVGAIAGRFYWTDEKWAALRFTRDGAEQFSRSMPGMNALGSYAEIEMPKAN